VYRLTAESKGEICMKNWTYVTVIAFLMIIFGFTACPPDGNDRKNNPDDPKDQTATITMFEGKTITVKGHFTNAEWNGVARKIETVIELFFENLPPIVNQLN
jgi:hypothetical protein